MELSGNLFHVTAFIMKLHNETSDVCQSSEMPANPEVSVAGISKSTVIDSNTQMPLSLSRSPALHAAVIWQSILITVILVFIFICFPCIISLSSMNRNIYQPSRIIIIIEHWALRNTSPILSLARFLSLISKYLYRHDKPFICKVHSLSNAGAIRYSCTEFWDPV